MNTQWGITSQTHGELGVVVNNHVVTCVRAYVPRNRGYRGLSGSDLLQP